MFQASSQLSSPKAHTAPAGRASRWSLSWALPMALACSLASTGCGSDADPSEDADPSGEDRDEATRGTGGRSGGGNCPSLSDTFETANRASWAVYGEVTVQTPDGPAKEHYHIGTAWAVDRRLLVTNAHVTEAFVDYAKQGVQFDRALGVQAGTGAVVELLRQLTHPGYNKDPFRSPDVGLFTTREEMSDFLPLAEDDVPLALGDDVQLVGFPGDVTEAFKVDVGTTVPQATSLKGTITSLRSHDDTKQVKPEDIDVIGHQAPTTHGTSGSALIHCGEVVGVHNSGTVRLVATPQSDGSLKVEAQVAAANNFAVHVRYVRDLLELFDDKALQGAELPVDVSSVTNTTRTGVDDPTRGVDVDPTDTGVDDPTSRVTNGAQTYVATGQVGQPFPHTFRVEVARDGTITGVANWGASGTLNLAGEAYFDDGSFYFVDDASVPGIYEGWLVTDSTFTGVFYEEGNERDVAEFQGTFQ